MLDYSSEAILAGAKLRTMAPSNQFEFNDEEYLSLIDDELQTTITAALMSVRQNYLLKHKYFTIKTNEEVLGFGLDNFGLLPFGSPIPITTADLLERCIDMVIKDIWYVDSNNKVLGQVPQISFAEITNYNQTQGFYFEDSSIVFHPINQFNNQNIKLSYFRKPGKLVKSDLCAKIIFSNVDNKTIQVDAVPTGWQIGTTLDIMRGKQAFDSIVDSVKIGSISGTVIELNVVPANLNRGDIVAPEGCAPVAQIPVNIYPLLMQRGAVKILESMKDTKGQAAAEKAYDRLENKTLGIISTRAQSNLKKLVGFGIWR